ncbi:MAG TPA: hypothetical protein VIJ77_06890 [Candidatus Tumulicola sp.]|jgi:Cu/Zn superoxide dismutase
MKAIRLALAAIALGAISFAFATPVTAATSTLTVNLASQNNSGESGTATLTQQPDGVQVVISLANAPTSAQPAHVHMGTCDKLNPAPEYPLTSITAGSSTTLIKGVTIDQLLAKPVAINVHKSTSDLGTYVACGNIAAS